MKIENFNNIGYIQHSFSNEELAPLKNEIDEFKNKKYVWGKIEKEFSLSKSLSYMHDLLVPICQNFEDTFNYLGRINLMNKGLPIALNSMWVNFQRKNEFLPVHNHGGIYSFVIWIKIPYDFEDERKHESSRYSSTIGSTHNLSGSFQFLFTDSLGRIQTRNVFLNKHSENTMLLFPSDMYHTVYPFYTSDEDRISVSGNFKLHLE